MGILGGEGGGRPANWVLVGEKKKKKANKHS